MRIKTFALALALGLAPAAMQAQQDTESIVAEWATSAHADASAEAFTHWNDEGEVPVACAICHAGAGFRDFHGLDGSAPGVDAPQPVGGVIDCDTCHVEGAMSIAEVTFPSGITLAPPEGNGTCYTCHQGRQSGPGVEAALEGKDDDTVDPEIGFLNPHYKAAAASLYGSATKGLVEYPGKPYAGQLAHVPGAQVCTDCHNPHTLEVKVETCATCHGSEEPKTIRIQWADVDGDGNTEEGLAGEIETLHAQLGAVIAGYAADTAGAPMVYSATSYPYFFNDTNGNGQADEDEAVYPNRYASWTPRLLRAAYNYQFVAKDPGAYAHNPQYTLQGLIDAIEDITGTPLAAAVRP